MNLHNRLLSLEQIMREPLPPIDWIIEPLIPPQNRIIVFGEFGSKKSWLLLDMGLHIASGTPWLGKFAIPQPRSVLYIDEEMPEYELRRRVKLLGVGLRTTDLPFRATSRLGLGFRGRYNSEYLLTSLKTQKFDPDVVIIETLRRVLDGSENEASDVGAFWRHVSPFLEAGKTLIISHHMRKPNPQFKGEDSRNRASGSTDILAGADCAFAVTREGDDFFKVECVKTRATKEPEPFLCQLVEDEDSIVVTTNVETIPTQLTKSARALALITKAFQDNPLVETTTNLCMLLEEHGIARRTAERALRTYKDTHPGETFA